jgi:hypothetical protein
MKDDTFYREFGVLDSSRAVGGIECGSLTTYPHPTADHMILMLVCLFVHTQAL